MALPINEISVSLYSLESAHINLINYLDSLSTIHALFEAQRLLDTKFKGYNIQAPRKSFLQLILKKYIQQLLIGKNYEPTRL